MAKTSDLARKLAALDAEIARLTSIREYLTADAPEPEKKRVRKPREIKTPRTVAEPLGF